jgi:hypothetical protein
MDVLKALVNDWSRTRITTKRHDCPFRGWNKEIGAVSSGLFGCLEHTVKEYRSLAGSTGCNVPESVDIAPAVYGGIFEKVPK